MKPCAILLLYQPGHRFRYKKYYLKAGDNYIGSDPSCQLHINSIVNPLQSKTANIHVGQNLMLLKNLSNEVHVYGNMNNKKKLVPLETNSNYYIQMEKDFFIGPYKTIVQVLDFNQLIQIKNVENQEKFIKEVKNTFVEFSQQLTDKKQNSEKKDIKNEQEMDQVRSDKTEQIKEDNNFEPTLQMDDGYGNFQPTIQMNDNENLLPTLRMDDQYGGFQPTIAIDNQQNVPKPINIIKQNAQPDKKPLQFKIPQIQSSQKTQRIVEFSQNTQKVPQASIPNNDEDDISMPDTLREDQMPATVKQNEQIIIPPPNVERMSKTAPQVSKEKQQQLLKKNKSWQLNKKKQPQKTIEDFDDLFDIKEKQEQKKNKKLFSSLDIMDDKTQILQSSKRTSLVEGPIDSKENSRNSKLNNSKKSIITKKFAVSGFKPTELQQNQLKKRGFLPISDPIEDYDVLIVGKDLKRTPRLLIALMKGKQIYCDLWIANPIMKIVGKVQGFPWESIQKRKGNAGNIFKGRYYLSQSLQVQFKQIMQVGGANFVEDLKKIKHNQQLLLIINVKQKEDQQLYNAKKHYKKWHFYSHLMIIQSALIGQEVREKYKVDQSSF